LCANGIVEKSSRSSEINTVDSESERESFFNASQALLVKDQVNCFVLPSKKRLEELVLRHCRVIRVFLKNISIRVCNARAVISNLPLNLPTRTAGGKSIPPAVLVTCKGAIPLTGLCTGF
jgi:hypothetical protein